MQVSNGKEEWKDAVEKARDLYEQGKKEMSKAVELAKERGQDAFDQARRKGQQAWEDAKVAGGRAWGEAKDRGEEAWEDAERFVRKYPSRAVGLALIVGVIVGSLIARDRD